MTIKETVVGAGLREVETLGRRLAETQGVYGDARVDWVPTGAPRKTRSGEETVFRWWGHS
jgi:hypothetical protein